MDRCPNQFPARDPGPKRRVAVVGEAPGSTELTYHQPFCGASGALLNRLLGAVGLPRETVFCGNVCQAQPPGNDWNAFAWTDTVVQDGIAALIADLAAFQPTLIVTLGNVPLHLFRVGNVAPERKRKGAGWVNVWPSSVSRWRGSLFAASPLATPALHADSDPETAQVFATAGETFDGTPWKCMATLHPAFVLRSMGEIFNLRQDLRRAASEAEGPLALPRLAFAHGPSESLSASAIVERLRAIRERRQPIGYDLEGAQFINCQAFATSPHDAFVIVTDALASDGPAVWHEIAAVLEDPAVPKWVWNAHHELAVLKLAHGITLRGWEDGMALWFERWPDLAKGLKYAASILTRQPYWAQGISFSDDDSEGATATRGEAFWLYNATDAAVTLELSRHPQLQPASAATRDRYALRKRLIEALTWASLHGIPYDRELAARLRDELTPRMWEAQGAVDELAGVALPATGDALLAAAATRWCHAVKLRKFAGFAKPRALANASPGAVAPLAVQCEPAPASQAAPGVSKRGRKAKAIPAPPPPLDWDAAIAIAKQGGADTLAAIRAMVVPVADPAARGQLASLLGIGINVKSTPQVVRLLDAFKLPRMFKRRASDESTQSKDAETLLNLYLKTGHPITVALLKTINLRTQLQECEREPGADGRMRSSMLSCGTETDRTTSKKWLDGTGGNLQTIPSSPVNFRRCYVAPPGHDWWKCDLTGADAWTVAARCASLGDDTMLADLLAGLRIPTLLGLALEGIAINKLDRDALKSLCAGFKKDWRDLAFKRCVYGSAYGMTPRGIRRVVVEDSYNELGEPRDPGLEFCARLQSIFLARYWGIALWHADVERQAKQTGGLLTASGLFREFFARRITNGRIDDATLRQLYAFEPQAVTTSIINRALDYVWTVPENRDESGEPILKPLLTVHDELDGLGPSERRDWCRDLMRRAFDQPLTIGRVTVKIPFVLKWGANWGEAKNS